MEKTSNDDKTHEMGSSKTSYSTRLSLAYKIKILNLPESSSYEAKRGRYH